MNTSWEARNERQRNHQACPGEGQASRGAWDGFEPHTGQSASRVDTDLPSGAGWKFSIRPTLQLKAWNPGRASGQRFYREIRMETCGLMGLELESICTKDVLRSTMTWLSLLFCAPDPGVFRRDPDMLEETKNTWQ